VVPEIYALSRGKNPFPAIRDAAYCKHVGEGPSHRHRQHAQKIWCGFGDIIVDKQTDPQTDILITILCNHSLG